MAPPSSFVVIRPPRSMGISRPPTASDPTIISVPPFRPLALLPLSSPPQSPACSSSASAYAPVPRPPAGRTPPRSACRSAPPPPAGAGGGGDGLLTDSFPPDGRVNRAADCSPLPHSPTVQLLGGGSSPLGSQPTAHSQLQPPLSPHRSPSPGLHFPAPDGCPMTPHAHWGRGGICLRATAPSSGCQMSAPWGGRSPPNAPVPCIYLLFCLWRDVDDSAEPGAGPRLGFAIFRSTRHHRAFSAGPFLRANLHSNGRGGGSSARSQLIASFQSLSPPNHSDTRCGCGEGGRGGGGDQPFCPTSSLSAAVGSTPLPGFLLSVTSPPRRRARAGGRRTTLWWHTPRTAPPSLNSAPSTTSSGPIPPRCLPPCPPR